MGAIAATILLLRPSPQGSSTRGISGTAHIGPSAPPTGVGGAPTLDLAPASVGARPERKTRLVSFGWGSRPDQVGRAQDPESAAEGPMAVALGPQGSLYVLDQVNGRILRRRKDGTLEKPILVGTTTAQDLLIDKNGGIALLDRLGEHDLKRYAPDGRLLDDQPLKALGLREAGGATGLYEGQNGALYVEESLIAEGKRVLHPVAGGEPLAGRPSRDGRGLVVAAIVDGPRGRFAVRGLSMSGEVRWETPLSVDRRILGIILLDTDVLGGVYAGVLHATTAPGSHDLMDERLELFRLDANGTPVGRLSVEHPPSGLETFRELTVEGPGVVLWMHPLPDDSGVAVDELRL